jgi:hypothetical protein
MNIHDIEHKWHGALNEYNSKQKEFKHWMYNAKTIVTEIPRLKILFEVERLNKLPTEHKQCSMAVTVPVKDNHLTCCLGITCRECPELLILDKIEASIEDIDEIKAYTCTAHILYEAAKRIVDTSEGFILTEDDKMYWQNVYKSLSSEVV